MLNKPAHLFNYLSCGPFVDETDFEQGFWNSVVVANKGALTPFAIFDRTRSEEEDASSFAGMASYMNASAVNLCVEIGYIVILPEFQRTHVTTNMVGLLAQYALDTPEKGGLGIRRLVWQCSAANGPSQTTAKRMGFQYEGTLRWHWKWPAHKVIGSNGKSLRKGDPLPESLGRDTVILSITFEEWESGTKEMVEEKVARKT